MAVAAVAEYIEAVAVFFSSNTGTPAACNFAPISPSELGAVVAVDALVLVVDLGRRAHLG